MTPRPRRGRTKETRAPLRYAGFLVDATALPVAASAGACGGASLVGLTSDNPKKKPDTMVLLAGKKKQVALKFQVSAADAAAAAPAAADLGALAAAAKAAFAALAPPPLKAKSPAKAAAPEAAAADDEDTEMVVDPWAVAGKIDYAKLVGQPSGIVPVTAFETTTPACRRCKYYRKRSSSL